MSLDSDLCLFPHKASVSCNTPASLSLLAVANALWLSSDGRVGHSPYTKSCMAAGYGYN